MSNWLETRQTVKKYSDKKIENSIWEQIKDAIYWAPTSHGFEPYRVLIINKDNSIRKELKPLMWNQGVVETSDKLVFFISLKKEVFMNPEWLFNRALRRATEVAGLQGEEAKAAAQKHADTVLNLHLSQDERDGDAWAMKQAYIALGMALETAGQLGIGSTPMEGLEKAKVEQFFREKGLIDSNERIAVVAAFGYPFDETSYAHWGSGKRVREPRDRKFNEI